MVKTIVLVLVIMFLAGCDTTPKAYTEEDANRFVKSYEQDWGSGSMVIYKDTKTGVKYLYVKRGYGAGLTRLID